MNPKPNIEILTNYGELCLVWFDTPLTIRSEQSRELYNLVKRHQPNCLLNVGPDYLGRVPGPSQDILRCVVSRLAR